MKVKIRTVFLLLVFCLAAVNAPSAQEAETIENAFKDGKISGTIGSYYEFAHRDVG
ncbi:MAG: hypothetical protein KAR07_09960 [Spirochaetes bacterium]|nr:hypothetical protein [Spirochaetota bacterium]